MLFSYIKAMENYDSKTTTEFRISKVWELSASVVSIASIDFIFFFFLV